MADFDYKTKKTKHVIVEPEYVLRKIGEAKCELSKSEFLTLLLSQLKECCDLIGDPDIKGILCYGLGQFSLCILSRYQLALLLLLKERINVDVLVYDPMFDDKEKKIIRDLELTLLTENDEAVRELKENTLVFLPHCSAQLTNNLLWANWSNNLRNCILLSNSFKKIKDTYTGSRLESVNYIKYMLPHMIEMPLINCFHHNDIFNDLSFHVLPKNKINKIKEDVWKFKVKPHYFGVFIEYITKCKRDSFFGPI